MGKNKLKKQSISCKLALEGEEETKFEKKTVKVYTVWCNKHRQ